MTYLSKADPAIYKRLASYSPGSAGFDGAWKSIANTDASKFDSLQHNFIKSSHYDPAVNKIKQSIGFDVSQYSPVLENVLWSTAVQHGSGGATNVFRNAGIRQGMSEAEIIRRVYAERAANNGAKYFSKSSANIRKSVVNRFNNELQDALKMLG